VSPPIEGEGVNLIVNPEKIHPISKCFRAGKGVMLQLSPSEIQANKSSAIEGEGIFGKEFDRGVKKLIGKKATKTIYKGLDKVAKPLVNKGLDAAAIAATAYLGPEAAPAIQAAKRAAKGYIDRPTAYQKDPAKELMKDVNPVGMAEDYAKGQMKEMMGSGILDMVKKAAKSKAGKSLQKKAIDMAMKQAKKQGVPGVVADALGSAAKSGVEGQGLYASAPSRGRGIMGRGAMMGCGVLPPALQSQNNSANFQFHTQLPPSYADLKRYGQYGTITGSGLYA